MTAFTPADYSSFRFVAWRIGDDDATVELEYALDDRLTFVERLTFPQPFPRSGPRRGAIERLVWLLHLVAGVSYYKTAAPLVIEVDTGGIPPDVSNLLTGLYSSGLAEFAWKNGLEHVATLRFPVESDTPTIAAPTLGLRDRALVPVGGGKDSIVTIEMLRRIGVDMTLFSVGRAPAITRTVAVAELPHLVAERALSDNLFDINRRGAFNGHVPVTAIVSLIACVVAVADDTSSVVMSNERSASEGSFEWLGRDVNHQYSKGLSVEMAMASVIRRHVAADLEYFSLLRPFSELTIARELSGMPQYWRAFTSCNAVFRIDADRRAAAWCGDCPKCRFVFLALAPFMRRAALSEIFGRDLLDKDDQRSGFAELTGLEGIKPFECVGEVEESAAALAALMSQSDWADDVVVRDLGPRLARTAPSIESCMNPPGEHAVPARFWEAIDAAGRVR